MSFFSFDKGDNFKLKNESNENKIAKINSDEEVDQSLFDEKEWDLNLTEQHKLATAIHNHQYFARERKTESESSDKKSKNETPKVTKEEEILKCMEEDAEELKRTYKPVR